MKISEAMLFILLELGDDAPSLEFDRLLGLLYTHGCIKKNIREIDGHRTPTWKLTDKGRRIAEKVKSQY